MYSLAPLHSFGLTSFSQAFVSLALPEDLPTHLANLDISQVYFLGEGSNTVFLEDYQGTIIKPAFMGIDLRHSDSHYLLKAGAGENWHNLVSWCMSRQIYGLENLALIPGSVGAAPIQNIGAYGVEIEQFIDQVEYYDLNEKNYTSLNSQECEFGYRDSVFKQRLAGQVVITSVTLAIPKSWSAVTHYGELKQLSAPSAMDIFNKVVSVRQSKLPDPRKIGNAGSFFKNPKVNKADFKQLQQSYPTIPNYPIDAETLKIPAAWLIEQLGFKGKKIGGIGCHANHALVLTNDGTGTGEQLLLLARAIKEAVLNEFSIALENEVRLIGKNGAVAL